MRSLFGNKAGGLLLGVLLVVFAALAVPASAQDSNSGGINVDQEIQGIFKYPVNVDGEDMEYAHLWFKQILGGFIFAPWSQMDLDNGSYDPDDITVLSKALGFTNVLAIILCLIIVYYMIVGGAINTASEGEVLGKQWNTPWLMLRTSLGFALITPLKVVGGMTMSFSQVAVIWLLMTGSNAASVLWTYIITEITQGTEIVSPNIELGASKTADLFKMMICADGWVRSKTDDHVGGRPQGNGLTASAREQDLLNRRTLYKIEYTDGSTTTGLSKTGSGGDDYMWGDESFDLDPARTPERFLFGPTGECGIISFPVLEGSKSNNDLAEDTVEGSWKPGSDGVSALNYKSHAIQAGGTAFAREIAKVLNDLRPAMNAMAKDEDELYYEDILKEISDNNPDPNSEEYRAYFEGYNHFRSAARRYAEDVVPAVHAAASGNPAVVEKMYNEMRHGGWAVAGVWFYELSALPGLTYNTIKSVNGSIAPESVDFCWIFQFWSNCDEMDEGTKVGYRLTDMLLNRLSSDPEVGFTTPVDASSSTCSDNGGCGGNGGSTDRLSIYLAQMLLGTMGNSNTNANPMDGPIGLSSPFLFAAEIGHTMNSAAQIGMISAMAVTTAKGMMEDKKHPGNRGVVETIGSIGPWGKAISFFLSMTYNGFVSLMSGALVIIGAIIMAAVSSGFMLAYVIPFMPVMTWIMMMAGYMLTVVEAIAAAPLAVVLLFTPEGQGIAGSRFERALQLVAMAILRPSFMVLGMLAGLTVSFVSFGMMNTFFFRAAEHVLSGTVFDIFAVVILYVSATYQLCKLMVESMHQLPDRIGEWFAGGVSRPFGESRISDSAEGSLGALSSQMSSLPTAIIDAQKNAHSARKSGGGPGQEPLGSMKA